jgi:hypothetical protein
MAVSSPSRYGSYFVLFGKLYYDSFLARGEKSPNESAARRPKKGE